MKEAIAKGYQKSRSRARDFLGKRGSQSRATFFSMSKREPRAEPLQKWPGSPSLVPGIETVILGLSVRQLICFYVIVSIIF